MRPNPLSLVILVAKLCLITALAAQPSEGCGCKQQTKRVGIGLEAGPVRVGAEVAPSACSPNCPGNCGCGCGSHEVIASSNPAPVFTGQTQQTLVWVFGSNSCGPCVSAHKEIMSPRGKQMLSEFMFRFIAINTQEDADKYGIKSGIPVFRIQNPNACDVVGYSGLTDLLTKLRDSRDQLQCESTEIVPGPVPDPSPTPITTNPTSPAPLFGGDQPVVGKHGRDGTNGRDGRDGQAGPPGPPGPIAEIDYDKLAEKLKDAIVIDYEKLAASLAPQMPKPEPIYYSIEPLDKAPTPIEAKKPPSAGKAPTPRK